MLNINEIYKNRRCFSRDSPLSIIYEIGRWINTSFGTITKSRGKTDHKRSRSWNNNLEQYFD